jgi:hypothetical protein
VYDIHVWMLDKRPGVGKRHLRANLGSRLERLLGPGAHDAHQARADQLGRARMHPPSEARSDDPDPKL